MGSGSYSVRHPLPQEGREAALAVWEGNLKPRSDPEDKYHWFYEANPLGRGETFVLDWVGGSGESRVVGSAGVGPRRVYCQGVPIAARLVADLAIEPLHRTAGPALALERAVQAHARSQVPVTLAFPNTSAVGVFLRLGYRHVGDVGTYVRILRHEPYLRRLAVARFGAGALGRALDLMMALRNPRGRAASQGLRFDPGARLDDRFDRLFEELLPRHEVLSDRSASVLRWRFLEGGAGAQMATLLEPGANRLKAYAITRPGGAGAVQLLDFLGLEPDLDALLGELVPYLGALGFESIRVDYLGAAWVVRLLRAHGFRMRESRPFLADVAEEFPPRAKLLESAGWHLTRADEDN